jgi:uncharacterized protein YecT (DUF1311 family)
MKTTTKQPRGWMLALSLWAACWLALGGQAASATPEEPAAMPALDACQRYATSHYQRASPERFASIQLLVEDMDEKKYEDKVGGQFVSTVLSGHGIWQDKIGAPSDVRFICLLENAEKPVFVDVVEEGRRDPVAVCWDGFEAAAWGKLTQCLQDSLKREEAALADELKKVTEQAGQSLDKASAMKTLQESNAQWVKYRDSECDRRQALVAGRNHPDIGELTCQVRETAERIADLRFDE